MSSVIWKPNAAMEQARVVVPCGIEYWFQPGVPKDVPAEHLAFVTSALQGEQGQVSAPNAPAISIQGTPATTTYSYKVSAVVAGQGETQLSANGTTTTGPATANGTNRPRITKPTTMPTQATGWRVVRTVGGSAQNVDISGVLALATASFDDIGIAGTPYTASSGVGTDAVVAGPGDL